MHIFLHHIWWFYKETGGHLNDFNAEGSEKLNDTIKTFYNRSSTKKNVKKSLLQITGGNILNFFRTSTGGEGAEFLTKKNFSSRGG